MPIALHFLRKKYFSKLVVIYQWSLLGSNVITMHGTALLVLYYLVFALLFSTRIVVQYVVFSFLNATYQSIRHLAG